MKSKRVLILLLILLLTATLVFTISYACARHMVVQYLKVLSIHDKKSFEANKDLLYKLTNDSVYKSKGYSPTLPALDYKINWIKCKAVKGFRSFEFVVNFEIIGASTITSRVVINKGRIIDAYREDDKYNE